MTIVNLSIYKNKIKKEEFNDVGDK